MNTTSRHPRSDDYRAGSASNTAHTSTVEVLSTRHLLTTELLSEGHNQTTESDLIFQYLSSGEDDAPHQSTIARRQEIIIWVLIVVLGVLSVFAFYLLYLKASGACGPSSVHCMPFADGLMPPAVRE